MRRIPTVLTMLVTSLLFAAGSAIACSIAVFEPPEAFERSNGVFIGQVRETGGWFNPHVVFTVEKSWKSVDSDEITLNVPTGCGGMSFVEGERYLVYTYEYQGDQSSQPGKSTW
jgi:hypothetical protein